MSTTQARRTALLVSADPPGGTYVDEVEVKLSSGGHGEIYYTMDGSSPVESAALRYDGAIVLTARTLLSFTAVSADGVWSEPQKELYIVDEVLTPPKQLIRVLTADDEQVYFSAKLGQGQMSQRVTVRSTGYDRVHVDRVYMASNQGSSSFYEPGVFSFESPLLEDFYLNPGEAVTLTVYYNPTDTLRTAAIYVESDEQKHRDGVLVIDLLGRIWDWGN